MLSSGAAPATELPQLYRGQAALLLDAGKYEKAENSLTRAVDAAPSDADLLLALAEVKLLRKKGTEAVGLMERAVSVRRAAGQPVPQSWLKRGAAVALQNKAIPQAMGFSRELVAAYPTPQNWRDALLVAREITPGDANARVDALRLLRQIKGLAGERDYLDLAQTLSTAGLNIEADSVLDEAVAANVIDPAKASYKEIITSTSRQAATERKALAGLEAKGMAAATGAAALSAADAHLGAGEYAKAAALYQAAIQKGSIDSGIAGTRLGIAQALAGQKLAAETALRSVNGPRAELSSLWLVWVAQRA
jgi:tetratricopeptide (TPR) repeat protein